MITIVPVVNPAGFLTRHELRALEEALHASRCRSARRIVRNGGAMTAAAAIEKNSFVLLQFGRRRFGLPAAIVTELAPPVKLHVFAHETPMVAGVIVRRGRDHSGL